MMLNALHVGCGPIVLPDVSEFHWTNVDKNERFPGCLHQDAAKIDRYYRPGTFDVVWSCHMLEHLDYPDKVKSFLAGVLNVTKRGGIFRLAVPDLRKVAELYLREPEKLREMYGPGKFWYYKDTPAERFTYFMREWAHTIVFDFDLLSRLLADAGFREIVQEQFRRSRIPGWTYDRLEGESMFIECIRP